MWRDIPLRCRGLRHFPLIDEDHPVAARRFPYGWRQGRSARASNYRRVLRTPAGRCGRISSTLPATRPIPSTTLQVFGMDVFSIDQLGYPGDRSDTDLIDKGEFWKTEEDRKLVMSPYHISRDSAPGYVAAIDQHRQVHPCRASAVVPLARYVYRRQAVAGNARPIHHLRRQVLTRGSAG